MENLDDGESSGDVLLEKLTNYLINPKLLPQISWTGRGKGKERKFALGACIQLINFLVVTVNKIDRRYNQKKVVSELIYGILKRAPTKYGSSKTSNEENVLEAVPKENVETASNVDNPAIESSPPNSIKPSSPTPSTSSTISTSSSGGYSSDQANYTAYMHQKHAASMHAMIPFWDGRYPPYGFPTM